MMKPPTSHREVLEMPSLKQQTVENVVLPSISQEPYRPLHDGMPTFPHSCNNDNQLQQQQQQQQKQCHIQNGHHPPHMFFATSDIEGVYQTAFAVFVRQWGLFLLIHTAAIGLIYIISVLTTTVLVGSYATSTLKNNDDYIVDLYNNDRYDQDSSFQFGDDYWYHAVNDDDYVDTDDYFHQDSSSSSSNSNTGGGGPVTNMKVVFVEWLLFVCIQCVADGATIRAVAEIYAIDHYDGHSSNHNNNNIISTAIMECLRDAYDKLCTLFLAGLIISVVYLMLPALLVVIILVLTFVMDPDHWIIWIVLLLLAFSFYAVLVIVMTYLTYPVIMIEHGRITGSIQRSTQLSEGHRVVIFSVLLLFGLIRLGCNAIVSTFLDHDNAGLVRTRLGIVLDLTMGGGRDGIVSVCLAIIFGAFGSILQSVLYFSIRAQKEGYHLALLRRELGMVVQESDPSSSSSSMVHTEYRNLEEKDENGVPSTSINCSSSAAAAAETGILV